jgi:hypothetical protein
MDSLSQDIVDDVVVMVGIDKHGVLEGLSMADRVILSDEGKKIFAYGLHASVRATDSTTGWYFTPSSPD